MARIRQLACLSLAGALASASLMVAMPAPVAVAVAQAPSDPPAITSTAPPWNMYSFRIRTLNGQARTYARSTPISKAWPPTEYHDSAGIPMRLIGGKLYYHPVGLALLGLKYVASYWVTKDRTYLVLAKRMAAGLEKISVTARGAIWFPYRFRFAMHGNTRETLIPPWYSAMAQGQALSLFTKLWLETRDPQYKALADRTYASLRAFGRRSFPWVSWIDKSRYAWLEEYPASLDYTLNGFIFAIYGLYDYYIATKDSTVWSTSRRDDVLALLRGSLATVRHYLPEYRNPGGASDYCLRHHKVSLKYHRIVTSQLRKLAAITGHWYFESMVKKFVSDAS